MGFSDNIKQETYHNYNIISNSSYNSSIEHSKDGGYFVLWKEENNDIFISKYSLNNITPETIKLTESGQYKNHFSPAIEHFKVLDNGNLLIGLRGTGQQNGSEFILVDANLQIIEDFQINIDNFGSAAPLIEELSNGDFFLLEKGLVSSEGRWIIFQKFMIKIVI